jgi:hypothetical protein
MSQVGAVPPDGLYKVIVNKVDDRLSKDKQSTNLFVTYSIMQSASDEEDAVRWEGKDLKETINVQESTLWKVQAWLEAATGKEWREDEMNLDPTEVMGRILWVEGVEGEYNGQKQFQIQNYYPEDMDIASIS